MRTVLAALIVLGFAATGCGYPMVGADPTQSKPPPRATPTSNPAAVQPATGTAKLISAELDQVRVIAARPKVPGYKRDSSARPGPTTTQALAATTAATPAT